MDNKKNYGSEARLNGLNFEKYIVDYYNISENKKIFVDKVKNKYPDIDILGEFYLASTKKADIYYKTFNYNIGISVKMSNKGTQLQIVSLDNFKKYLEFYDIKLSQIQEDIFKKFLGILKPSKEELKTLNIKRTKQNKNSYRYWLTEIDNADSIIDFLRINYSLIIKFILCDGLCKNKDDKADFFIFNQSYYTKTKIIDPVIYSYDEILKKLTGTPNITKNGNLELCRTIGLQRKGSGKGLKRNQQGC